MVLKAIILFISFWASPHNAATNAVMVPIKVITNNAVGLYSSIGLVLTKRYNPAVTSVQTSVYFLIQKFGLFL
jgi:hypothetical protein